MGAMSSGSSKGYISRKKVDYLRKKKESKEGAGEALEEDAGYHSYNEVSDEDLDTFAAEGAFKAPAGKEEEEKKKRKPGKRRRHKQEIDTNIVSIKAQNLNDSVEYATGDPIPCAYCKAIFNKFSQLVKVDSKQVWTCEFCGTKNEVVLDEGEYPKSHYLTYLLEGKAGGEVKLDKPKDGESDISVVFCIDVSGSMDATQHYKGPKLKYMNAPSYITRLQCVKIAIDDQLGKMQIDPEMAQRKVGFVTFENAVSILGDHTTKPKTYSGPVLDNYSSLLEDAINQTPEYLSKPLKESYDYLLNSLKTIRTGGATALGPALLISVAMAAQGKPGSRVIICTDGLANRGLGNLDKKGKDQEDSHEFYTQVAQYAKSKGVTISLITLVEEGCRLDLLSPVANLTGGGIIRVNPLNLGSDFSEVLSERVIASNVNVKVILHKALQFRNEDERCLTFNKTIMNKEIGNATKETAITFEYSVKPPKELLAMADVDLEAMKSVPLQAQITYVDAGGRKCLRLLSQVQEVTNVKEEALKLANKEVIGAHIELKAAEMAEKGDIRGAQAHAFNYAQMAGGGKEFNDNFMPLYQALDKEHHENLSKHIEVSQEQSDNLAEAINRAYRQKKKK